VIGTKKEEQVPVSPRGGSFINMKDLTKPNNTTLKKSVIKPIAMKSEVSSSDSQYSGDEQNTDKLESTKHSASV
jgi:hypothetical protein